MKRWPLIKWTLLCLTAPRLRVIGPPVVGVSGIGVQALAVISRLGTRVLYTYPPALVDGKSNGFNGDGTLVLELINIYKFNWLIIL